MFDQNYDVISYHLVALYEKNEKSAKLTMSYILTVPSAPPEANSVEVESKFMTSTGSWCADFQERVGDAESRSHCTMRSPREALTSSLSSGLRAKQLSSSSSSEPKAGEDFG